MGELGRRKGRGKGWRWLALALPALLAAPGSAAPEAEDDLSCEPRGPCDGALTGSWRLARSCIELVPPAGLCAAAKIDGSGVAFDGTLDFVGDGSFAVSITPRGTWTARVPGECLMGLSCAELADAVMASGQGAPLDRATCEERAGGCQCAFKVRRQTQWEEGSFAKAGGVLTLDRGRAETESFDHCAAGDRLTIAAGKLAVGAVSITGDLVLRRR